MSLAELFRGIWEGMLATGAASLLVLALRVPVRRLFGARVAYALWAMVPAALLAVLLPAPVREIVVGPLSGSLSGGGAVGTAETVDATAALDWTWMLIAVWGCGVVGSLVLLVRRQQRFVASLGPLRRRGDGLWQADVADGLPAVIGWSPRIVLPSDFEHRFVDEEQELIVMHERLHARRGDLQANALAAGLACLHWFNPLRAFVLDRFRRDQELACDQTVLARRPQSRRRYGEAMLKAGGASLQAPLACQWLGYHPLKERITMLASPLPTLRRRICGSAVVFVVIAGTAWCAWAQQPARVTIAQAPAEVPPTAVAETLVEESSLEGKPVSLTAADMPAVQVARMVADEAGLSFDETMPNGDRKLTMAFSKAKAGAVLKVIGDETKTRPVIEGNVLRFVPQQEGQGAAIPTPAGASIQLPESVDATARNTPPPKYPKAAYDADITGKVILIVDVSAEGRVTNAVVERSEPAGVFDQTTLDAARNWTFEPAREDGKPVASQLRVPVDFSPEEADAPTSVDAVKRDAPAPAYPKEAFDKDITGKVIVIVDVSAEGRVTNAVVERSEPAGVFDQATLDAARNWTFEPARKDGKPVASRQRVPVEFSLEEADPVKRAVPSPPESAGSAAIPDHPRLLEQRKDKRGSETIVNIDSATSAVARGGIALSEADAGKQGLKPGYQWVDLAPIGLSEAHAVINVAADAMYGRKGDAIPRYAGYRR